MKKFLILFALLFLVSINIGCKKEIEGETTSNNSNKEETLIKDDFNKFITDYFVIYCGLRSNQFRFWDDYYNNKRVRSIIDTNNSDIPAMRFLGKQGLNDLEISEIDTKLNELNKNKISEDFPNSMKDLNNSKKYLERFFQGSRDLADFNEFQTNVSVDLITYRENIEGLQYSLTNECDLMKHNNPSFFEGDEIQNFCDAEEMCNLIRGYTLNQENFKES